MKIYVCFEYVQVGDELVHTATLDKVAAEKWKRDHNRRSRTVNYDIMEIDDMVERSYA